MKKLSILTLAAALVLGATNFTVDAATTQDLRDQLVSVGVPAASADNLVTYLSTVKLSKADCTAIENVVKEAYALIGNRTDLTKLSSSEKQQLVALANQAASKLGLVVSYNKVDGGNSVIVTTTKGETLVSLSSQNLQNLLTNFDGNMVSVIEKMMTTAVEIVVEKTNNSTSNSTNNSTNNSTSVTPIPASSLTQTGDQVSMVVMAGAGLVALAAGVMVVSQRRMEE
ncbi:hypothetical protein [Turicibacter sanguinis]|uniref:hypothetical protein n=1 Tax=Turicibacter sanguinis TaxID=154288 RepID=UPI0018ABAE23|nr:hypothetical protein [Turicibacter sanguinis]MDB8550942.1 hypothetical protein [Turicibacter sanguinis]